jgi:hypothetical protein
MYNFKKNLFILLFCLFSSFSFNTISAQCPMCRMSAEADLKNGGSNAKGLNTGIVYMLVIPYILLGTFGYLWYKERKRIGEAEQISDLRALMEPHEWK